jgi:hypothetical protein
MAPVFPRYPALYQINTRVWLHELARDLERPVTLDGVPDTALDQIAARGFDWVWLLGIWQTGPASRGVARSLPNLLREFHEVLPDLTEEDITGSPFAVQGYQVHKDFGGDGALRRLRQRLAERGLRLVLDFMPNHTALDHPWVQGRPDFYIHGTDADLAREPQNYRRVITSQGSAVLAHGRDPYFPGWTDTFQLNYRHPGLREAMMTELARIAERCDGVRCDMAMLILPEVIQRTWGQASSPSGGAPPVDTSFWLEAIARVRASHPDFRFMAEVYWDLEWTLQQQGFDYTYDKRLYDRLLARAAGAVRGHLHADLDFQNKSARFLENHDEPRAAAAFPPPVHEAAAVMTFLVPGLRFFHEGQLEGRKIHVPVQLRRRPDEPVDGDVRDFYLRLLACLRRPEVRQGHWQLLECRPAWEGNPTWDQFIAFTWEGPNRQRLLVTVHYGPFPGQCYVGLPFGDLAGRSFLLRDLLGPARYERDGSELARHGLYLDMPAWGYHVFEMSPRDRGASEDPPRGLWQGVLLGILASGVGYLSRG